MSMSVRDAGTWKAVNELHVKDAGTWKSVQKGWVRDAGVWKEFFSGFAINITNKSVSDLGFTVRTYTSSIAFRNTGQLRGTTAGVGTTDYPNEWQNPVGGATASDYEVRATEVSQTGVATRTGTMNTWLNLGTDRTWTLTANNPSQGVRTWVIDFEIRDVATSTVQATARITLDFEYAP